MTMDTVNGKSNAPSSENQNSSSDVSAETSPRTPLHQRIEAQRARLLQAQSVLACLYEVLLYESFLAHGAEAMSGGERHQVVLHVSAETLGAGGGDRCEIEDGPAVAAETARRLACDASLVTIVENEKGEPLSVGRKTRSIPPASPAARTRSTRTLTTSSTGPRAVRRRCPIS
jgi:hypothetical protein